MLFNYDVTLGLFRWGKIRVFLDLKRENKHQSFFTACSGPCRLCGVTVDPIKTPLPALFHLKSLRSILKKSEVLSAGQSETISTNQLPSSRSTRWSQGVSAQTGGCSVVKLRPPLSVEFCFLLKILSTRLFSQVDE